MKHFHILPKQLDISGKMEPQIRYRSIYEAVVYGSRFEISGSFTLPALSRLNINQEDILWDKSLFSIGISDMKGIKEDIRVIFDGKEYGVDPGLKTSDIASAGVSSQIPLSPAGTGGDFSFSLNLNGSDQIQFTPVAEQTRAAVTSTWPSPSFNGSFLPASREISDNGFTAEWKVLHLNRNYPQYWLGNQYRVNESNFGVKLLITSDVYQKSIRISKYALMFIVFTFAAFFFSEIINRNRVHPIQYLLIGLAVILFYVLLLAISEHLRFDYAYVLSAAAITLLITWYSSGIIRNRHFTLTVFAVLAVLYLYLYIVLQVEDYALILGSIGLLAVLGTVMFITRKIDWYSLDLSRNE